MTHVLEDCTRTLHVISQYLAAIGINYSDKKPDDSHTSAGWNEETSSFISREIPSSAKLIFNLPDFTLEWVGKRSDRFSLNRKTHANVVSWISEKAEERGLRPFEFKLHYELDSGSISDDHVHEMPDRDDLLAHASLRTVSQSACRKALRTIGKTSEIRVWPHHFDTGAFFKTDSGIGIGFGMAIPDSMIDDYYLYTYGWKDARVEVDEMKPLVKGEWRTGKFKGATLAMTGEQQSDLEQFLVESIKTYQALS